MTERLSADWHSSFGAAGITIGAAVLGGRAAFVALASCAAMLAALALPSRAAAAEADATPQANSVIPSAPSRIECMEAHQSAQQLKHESRLVEAQEKLLVCSSGTCPGAVISDCGQWITELEQVTPSMVFEVRLDGQQVTNARLFVDDRPVLDWTHALKVNPGRHVIRVELPPFELHEESVVLPEGQRMRLVAIEFKSEKPAAVALPPSDQPKPVPSEPNRPTPVLVYPLLGVGIAGLAGFGVLSLMGSSKQKELEQNCKPNCTDSELEPMQRVYAIGDLSAGVGAAALLGAGVLYLVRPTQETRTATGLSFDAPKIGLGRGGLAWVSLSATRTW